MKLVSVQCPSCGASLKIDDGLNTFFCQYCGNRIIMDEQSPETIKAKVRMKELKHDETIKDKEQAHEINKINIEEKNNRKSLKLFIGMFVGIILLCIVVIIVVRYTDSKEDKKLQEIVNEIQSDIAEENYDIALIKANTLYFTGDSNEMVEKWDNMRNSLIDIINEAAKK